MEAVRALSLGWEDQVRGSALARNRLAHPGRVNPAIADQMLNTKEVIKKCG
jgi:hypothetical protein